MKMIASLATLSAMLTVSSPAAQKLTGECRASFLVKATMHSFTGTATSEPVVLTLGKEGAAWTVEVAVATMETGNKKRDVEMREMFHVGEFPVITGVARAVDLEKLAGDVARPDQLPFTLAIAGVTREMTAAVSNWKEDDQGISFDATFTVSLKDYQLKPPSIMKMIRVHDTVGVETRFAFSK